MTGINYIIIDDEKPAVNVIIELAKRLKPELTYKGCAHNGVDALKAIDKHKPQLIFLDINLPVINGIDIFNQIDQKNIQVIWTTGSLEHALEAIKKGASDFLLKPVDPIEFIDTVDHAINKINQDNQHKL